MPGIQEWIHKFEVAEGTRYVKWTALVLIFLAVAAVYNLREYKNFSTQTAMDQAQLAKNLADGEGYNTDFIRPLSIYLLQKNRDEAAKPVLREEHPDLANPPVYPVLLAGLMKVLPMRHDIPIGLRFQKYSPEVWIALFNQALFFLAIILVFRLGLRLFDASVAWLSALVFAGTELFWRFSVSGLSTMLLVVIFLALVWCLVSMESRHREQRGSWAWFAGMALLSGLLVGVAGLTRYSFGWLIVPVLAFFLAFFGGRRGVLALLALGAFLLVMTPWLARNYLMSDHWFGTAAFAIYQETPPFQGNRLERFLGAEFDVEVKGVLFFDLMRKLVTNLQGILKDDVIHLGGNWLAAFFLVGLLIPFQSQTLSRLRLFLVANLGLLILVQSLGRSYLSIESPDVNAENLLVVLAPLAFIFGAAMFFTLLDQINFAIPQLRALASGFVGLLLCAPLLITFLPPRSSPLALPPYWPPGIHDLSKWIEKDELMMSDMPWAVAWYGNRQCVWVTLDAPFDPKGASDSDFYTIYDYQKPIQALYLTTLTTDARLYSQMLKDKDYEWGRFMLECLLRTNVPSGFPMRHAPPGFLQNGQLYLADHPRWNKIGRN